MEKRLNEMAIAKNKVLRHLANAKAALDNALEIKEKLYLLEPGKKTGDAKGLIHN